MKSATSRRKWPFSYASFPSSAPSLYAFCKSPLSLDTSLSLNADKYPIAIALPSSDNVEKKTEILVPSKISFSDNVIVFPPFYCLVNTY